MKIKKLEFCNVNSLAGEWVVDFESPDFAKSSMYCIVGPTGSGKTSILDAICLGLYGRTPRISTINSGSNEVMTYGTKKCSAKVTFECNGIVYSAHWEQNRKPKSDALQQAEWKLTNETAQSVVTTCARQNAIEAAIAPIIGLDFDQFTKSMMLAQGEFNKFLKCNENERAAILEKLTGDGIYRKIAMAVHQLYEEADEAVKTLEAKLGDVTLLSEEELVELNAKIAEASSLKEKLAQDEERFRNICTWYENFHGIESHLKTAKEQLETANREKAGFEPNREKLERALRAQEVETSYAEYHSVRDSLSQMKNQLAECQSKLPDAVANLEKASTDNREKHEALEKCKADYSENEKLWERVSSLDGDIRNTRTQLNNLQTEIAKFVAEIDSTQGKIKATQGRISENEQKLNSAKNYVAANEKDGTIDGMLSLLKSNVTEWKTENAAVIAESKKLAAKQSSLQEFDAACEQQKQDLRVLQEYLTAHQADADLVNVLPEMNGYVSDAERHHKESLRLQGEMQSKQNQVAELTSECEQVQAGLKKLLDEKESIIQQDIPVVVAELRRTLKSGEPCPVCGSRDHLSCEEHATVENGAECLNDFATKLRKISGEMDQTQRKLDGLATRQQNIENLLDETAQKQKGEVDAELAALKLLNEKIEPWQMTATLETARSVLQNLQTLKTTYLQKKENADSLQNKVNNAAVDRANLVSDLNVTDDTLKKSQGKVQELSTKIETALATWFSNVRMEEVDALIAGLEKKNTSWKKNQDDMLKAERDLEKDLASVAQFEENLKQVQSRRDEMSAQFESTKQGLEKNEELRKDLFGEKSVDDERNKARSLRDTAERLANEARNVEMQKRDAKMALDNSIADLNRRIAETEPKLSENQKRFLENLAAKNFANEEEFKAAKLPEMERKSLQQTQKRVDDNLTAAQTSVKNFNDQLAAHLQKRNFEDSEESATQNREAAKTKLAECNLNFGTWTEQKRNDDLKRQQFADLQTQLTTLQEKRGDWLQMQCWFNGNNARTGNGDVFVKFIQSITLRNLLKIANGYLHDMFPRYEMVAAKETLDIMLIDHDNSDAIRPIKNISGGEGFIVSLSLALGISTIASQNVSIDSLFLDEGFGTLDTKMLQETVVVLQKMQQERGKLLGVITHLDLVKNELQTHIEVTPRGGRSFLSGAGVSNG